MNKKNKEYVVEIISLIVGAITSILLFSKFINKVSVSDILATLLFTTMLLIFVFIFWQRLKLNQRTTEVQKLDKLIGYNKKRKEIDEEINLLTRELMHSSLSEYLDINRLVFGGQNEIVNNKSVNYNAFFEQFGLSNEKMEIRKNSAIFLTAFNEEGNNLFNKCQRILGDMDIFLQKTDNYVEKEDIMMNIVSLIVQSEIVIVNINGRNPNVYYELGIAHAIGKPTILLSKADFDINNIGFDVRQKRIIIYNSLDDLEKQLLYQVNRLIK